MDNPPVSLPIIPVQFIYVDEGTMQKSFRAVCSSVPRVGELVFPQAGSAKVIVHAVAYRAEPGPGETAIMTPTVVLRELTSAESAQVGSIFHG